MFDVAVLGSANLDLVVTVDRHPTPGETLLGDSYSEFAGGKGLNQAVAAARASADVAFIGAVGDDNAGHMLRTLASDEGIDVSKLATAPTAPTGRAAIVVNASGDNSIVVVPGANATVTAPEPLPPCRVLLAQLEVPIEAVRAAFQQAHAAGVRTLLNPAPARQIDPELLALCDVAIPNEHEVDLLGGVEALHAAGVDTVIVTRGAAGVTVSRDGDTATLSAPAVDVVDTTGAGDSFCGNLAARLAAGDGIVDAVRWAVAAAALTVTVAGAVPSIPTAAATAAHLASESS